MRHSPFSPPAEQTFYEPEAPGQSKQDKEACAEEGEDLPRDPEAGEQSLAEVPAVGMIPFSVVASSTFLIPLNFSVLHLWPLSHLCQILLPSRVPALPNPRFIMD